MMMNAFVVWNDVSLFGANCQRLIVGPKFFFFNPPCTDVEHRLPRNFCSSNFVCAHSPNAL
jgi:hypothetical protein